MVFASCVHVTIRHYVGWSVHQSVNASVRNNFSFLGERREDMSNCPYLTAILPLYMALLLKQSMSSHRNIVELQKKLKKNLKKWFQDFLVTSEVTHLSFDP